jgi:hypothetical protein
MPVDSPLLRPRDTDALRAELRHVAAAAGLPVTFGGEVRGAALRLTEFVGTQTHSMRGLAVRPSAGLGGATMVARRPMSWPTTARRPRSRTTTTRPCAGRAATEEIREVHAQLRRLAADPSAPPALRVSCACSLSDWRGEARQRR